jgi:hypothetical protein
MNNGQSVNLHLNLKRDDPRFADLLAGRCRAAPKTDGQSVYWTDGPRLTFDEIMEMVVT